MRILFAFLLLTLCFGESRVLAQPAPAPKPANEGRQTRITLQEIWASRRFSADGVPGFNFTEGSNRYTRISSNTVEELDFVSGELTQMLFDFTVARSAQPELQLPEFFDDYALDKTGRYILVTLDEEQIFRYSRRANFYVYDREQQRLSPLDTAGKQMYASFSPDGKSVAYVRDNNLYWYDIAGKKTRQITSDGERNAIINGASDWVYEEEFGLVRAFEWSPDSKSILFLRFDERLVPEFTMEMYTDELYPEYITWKYPKVGEPNATVAALVYDLPSGKTRQLYSTGNGDMHIPRIYWTGDSKPLVWVTNRHQDSFWLKRELRQAEPLANLLVEGSDTYLDVHDNLRFLKDGSFLWTSEQSGYNHLYHYSAEGKLIRQLTKGNYPVTEFYGYDEKSGMLYFQAAMKNPMQREVYKMPLKGGQAQQISSKTGWNDAVFAADFSSYMLSYSSAVTPPQYTVHDASGRMLRELVDNAGLQSVAKEEGFQPLHFWSFKTVDGTELNGWRITPEGFDEASAEAWPLMMFVYGGPGSQQVVDRWGGANHWWFQMLAQQGYVVACVDNRGTGARGAAFQKQTYLELGKLEVEDQIAAARYLGSQPWIDASRIGIFGWSYGGYMTSLCITKGADVFKLAIAVAPVTNWKWYDTLYTERYMRTLAENSDGYRNNSPVYFADRLKGHYLLVHGMGDDNVHFQHSVEMVNALVAANKEFELFAYPNKNHGIYGGYTRLHLYNKMTDFILANL